MECSLVDSGVLSTRQWSGVYSSVGKSCRRQWVDGGVESGLDWPRLAASVLIWPSLESRLVYARRHRWLLEYSRQCVLVWRGIVHNWV
eukprot:736811-Lingulodinium_polyedra.AAC.1